MNIAYRPDIDGLRAVAVLLVIFYHLDIGYFRGGFVGVDVFFVISGFLITSIIKTEIQAGTFSLGHFYQRRITRIAPAFIFLMLTVSLMGYFLLLPLDLMAYTQSLVSTLLLASNLFFLNTTGGYFDKNISVLPLIHTWSIAVEEQFYLVWPLAMIGLAKINQRAALSILVIIFMASLAYGWSLLPQDRALAYYVFPARAFELMMGASIVFINFSFKPGSRWMNHLMSIAGILLIFGSAILLNDHSNFPGLNALYPCIGAVLLILAGRDSQHRGMANGILQKDMFVRVGLWSYSLYLWHWPLIAFSNYRRIFQEDGEKIFLLLIIFLVSIFSYQVVENYFRKNNTFSLRKTFIWFCLVPLLLGISLWIFVVKTHGLGHRPSGYLPEFSAENDPVMTRSTCNSSWAPESQEECVLGDREGPFMGLLLGDSHANANWAFLDVLAKDAGFRLEEKTINSTPPIPGISFGLFPDQQIQETTTALFNASTGYDMVILSAEWPQYDAYYKKEKLYNEELKLFSQGERNVTESFRQLLDETIARYIEAGVKVVLIDTLQGGDIYRIQSAKKDGKDITQHFYKTIKDEREDYVIPGILQKYPQAIYINPNDVLCADRFCDMEINGTVLYKDEYAHLNSLGSRLLGEKYLAMMGNPLK